MNGFYAFYIALTVFGFGVTLVDMFGLLGHGDTGSDNDGGHDGPDGGHDSDSDNDGDFSEHGEHQAESHESGRSGHSGIIVSDMEKTTRMAAKAISVLRIGVYFSLGAGPTGIAALLSGNGFLLGGLWAITGGVFTAIVAKWVRGFMRSELDSSFSQEELLMEKAEIIVSVKGGALGKATARKFGVSRDIFVKAADPSEDFPVGAAVRLVDFDEECWFIRAWDGGEDHGTIALPGNPEGEQ